MTINDNRDLEYLKDKPTIKYKVSREPEYKYETVKDVIVDYIGVIPKEHLERIVKDSLEKFKMRCNATKEETVHQMANKVYYAIRAYMQERDLCDRPKKNDIFALD